MRTTGFVFSVMLFIIFSSINIYSQNNTSEKKDSQQWFTYNKITEEVWQISDNGNDNIYLVFGKDSVLIIDTGIGEGNLKEYVTSLTKLPIIVVNTHGHPDHAGSNFQFQKVYAHPEDFKMIRMYNEPKIKKNNTIFNQSSADKSKSTDSGNTKQTELIPIKEGYVFDLGERKLEVIEVPGHTKGSICLFDKKTGMLITGDNNNAGQTWLHLADCTPLEVYKRTLEKLLKRKSDFKLLLIGHGGPFDTDLLDEHLTLVNNILSGSCKGEDFSTFAGPGKICKYKRVGLIFRPENLFEKK